MRFKLGLIIGLVIGFSLGARAGRERYDRLVARLRSLARNDAVQQVASLSERSTRKARASAGGGLVSLADSVRARTAP